MTQENSNPESSDLQIFLTHYNYNYAQFTSHLNQNWENIVIVLKSNTFSQYHHAIPHEHPSNSSSGREFASDAGDRCSIPGRKKKKTKKKTNMKTLKQNQKENFNTKTFLSFLFT